jgi:hypothetical protein
MYVAEITDMRPYAHLNISGARYNAVNVRIMHSTQMKCPSARVFYSRNSGQV